MMYLVLVVIALYLWGGWLDIQRDLGDLRRRLGDLGPDPDAKPKRLRQVWPPKR